MTMTSLHRSITLCGIIAFALPGCFVDPTPLGTGGDTGTPTDVLVDTAPDGPLMCEDGFVDLNGDPSDGCECKVEVEICDGFDNDCNPRTPDGLGEPTLGQACDTELDTDLCEDGVIVCEGASLFCNDDELVGADLCDGIDNDCDPATPDGANDPMLGIACDGADADECTEGVLECGDAALVCNDLTDDTVELCNMDDDDCDGTIDEGLGLGDACDGIGECGAGVLECDGAGGVRCSTDPGGSDHVARPEICDGLDNNCDGATDEGFDVGGSCNGAGECGRGSIECDGAGATRCSTEPGGTEDESSMELCDGSNDEDCDGSVDESFMVGESCTLPGICGPGAFRCAGDGTAECNSIRRARVETCEGRDQDCDGNIDEDFNIGRACDGVGECGAGVLECDGERDTQCSTDRDGSEAENETERCDDLDNDCDGDTDETFNLGNTCNGVGECGSGIFECAADETRQCSTDIGGSAFDGSDETCNSRDDDCDGDTDEDFDIGASCDGVGACGDGEFECAGGSGVRRCSTDPGGSDDESSSETCNDDDDDCDGDTDEDFDIGTACDGIGECGAGVLECAGAMDTRCSSDRDGSAPDTRDETCDGLDNDCDEEIDEREAGVDTCEDCTHVSRPSGTTYQLCRTGLSWLAAEAACEDLGDGYHLASISGGSEDAFLGEAMDEVNSSEDWWIGLNDRDTEDSFEWSNGEAFSYGATLRSGPPWAVAQPNNDDPGPQNCVEKGTDERLWNDDACVETNFFACELE